MTVTCIRLSASPSVPWFQTIGKGPLGGGGGGGKRYRRCRCSLSWHGGQNPDSGEEERTSQGPLSRGLLLFCLFRFKETCRKQRRGGWRCRIGHSVGVSPRLQYNIRHFVSRTFTSIQAFKCLPHMRKEINLNQFIQNFGKCRKRIDDSLKFKSTRSGYLCRRWS